METPWNRPIVQDLLVRYQQTREPEVRNALFALHQNLVHHIVRRYLHRGEPADDLVQVASMGLLRAIERYSPECGTRFATYAIPTMCGMLLHYFRDHGWHLKIPRRLGELHSVVQKMVRTEEGRTGRPPSRADMAKRLKVSERRIAMAQEAAEHQALVSLDADLGAVKAAQAALEPGFEKVENCLALRVALGALDTRERSVVFHRYFGDLAQSEVAELLHLSPIAVSRAQASSLHKMRQVLSEQLPVS